ncbi:hypothetical protein [Halobellus ordinarius]|uniref:hypothetical protein n=1 Tax=Halobellus ordinarius TaxID=3075120 RepID=UPI002880A406|nr:hypothetical protein [Halobellus sp. ZY16]
MTQPPRSDRGRASRRQFLSLAGALGLASLAGCADRLPGTGPETIDGDALSDMVDDDAPTVPETLPIDIDASFIDEQRAAAQAKLDDVPAPFDADAIPNGVIRERLNDNYSSARESLRRASDAPTPYERLGAANHARTDAHEVSVAWRAIEDEVTVAALRSARSAVSDDVDAFIER